ncbi:Cys-tRNA(Pro)/Cys-tRNA(Cys) deacylase, ybaK family [Halanaeroarchaeum sp. HSR-CO]|uniref:YbaK/EbsC family protein n=1 Tax=Halanaeroarchaeum sp. HSR-CO TaxID=2866382 RepID=UPI00217DF20A|nr:YbaK/EbsC family protein [Halanaeroarchaeum sp. HSR-CO]UWG46922.1 Cys-tRNA(Pro)/Cys-tRNA(Cys) deacylase, ybaK family [Halanaeroarchaeum sp. HSR-CO]
MHPTAREFVAEVEDRYGLRPEAESFDEGTKTAADAADAIGCDVAQIASSIVMVADDRVVVVVTSGANHVDEDQVADALQADSVRMATPEEASEATGWSIGGVPPICHESDVPVLFDETLLDFDTVWAAAGTPDTVWPVGPDHLRELADATPVQVSV